MTASANLICSKCGFSNVPGDQFCGSCGAFLEWEGVAADPAPATTGAPADVPVVGPPAGRGAVAGSAAGSGSGASSAPGGAPGAPGGASATSATAAASPVAASGPSSATPRLTRCPACGIANEPGRTFCQSCGTKLPDTGGVASASADQIAAAVAAPNQPAVVKARAPGVDPAAGSGGGGLLRWLVVVAVIGIVVGIAVVAGTSLLRGSASSDASSNPSLAVLPSAGGSGAPRASAGASGGPGASGAAAVSVPLGLTGAKASSVVGDLAKFQPEKAIDGDPNTCWQEGNASEKGEWIEVTFPASRVTSLILTNGYNASRQLYRGNHRLKDVQVSVNGGSATTVRLKDVGTPQRVELPPVDGATTIRITIGTIYPAVKTKEPGTPFDDAALGEIVVMGVPAP